MLTPLCFIGLTGCGTDAGASGSAKDTESTGNAQNKTEDADDVPGDSDRGQNASAIAGKNSSTEEGSGTGEGGSGEEGSFDGTVLESYPAQFGEVYSLSGYGSGTEQNPGGSYYDLCGLYLQVLDDLWNRDPGLKAVGKYLQNGGALK